VIEINLGVIEAKLGVIEVKLEEDARKCR